MKLITFGSKGFAKLGAMVSDTVVLDLSAAAALVGEATLPGTMQALIEAGEPGLSIARSLVAAAPKAALLPLPPLLAPIPAPIRLRDCCLFLEHMEVALDKIAQILAEEAPDPPRALAELRDTGKYLLHPEFRNQIIYYNADHLHVYGPDGDIHWPVQPGWADYELEWACVIGKTGRDIERPVAHEYIFGFTIFNDWSARDIQIPFMQANLGPSEGKDFANSFGPCIATADEFTDKYNLRMAARVNGVEWSRGSTRSMYHRFEDAIVQFSRGKILYAGEIIGSGTVLSGCGLELNKKLSHGDIVELEVEGIGILRNRVIFPHGPQGVPPFIS